MKKKLLILVVGVISIFNLSILIENSDGINIGLDYLKIAKAETENIENNSNADCSLCGIGGCDCWASCNGGPQVYCPNSSCIKVN